MLLTFCFSSSLVAMQCLHGRNALNPSLKPPTAWLPRLSARTVTILPWKVWSPWQVLNVAPYKKIFLNTLKSVIQNLTNLAY